MSNGSTRYHAEVQVTLEGRSARINVFADTMNEIFLDVGTICSQFPQDWMNPAKREIVNAERKAAQIRAQQDLPRAKDTKPDPSGEIPVCAHCGSSESMELIHFTDKKTGKPAQAWKCQDCHKWHFTKRN